MESLPLDNKSSPWLIPAGGAAFLAVALLSWRFAPALFSENFLPHRYCYLAKPDLIWANAITDGIIFISYVWIFASLFWVAHRSRTLLIRTLIAFFLAFGVFILACGMTHLMEIIVIWTPFYWLSAVIKAITALASGVTAFALAGKKRSIVDAIGLYQSRLDASENERKSAVAALVANDKLAELGRLSAAISHEISNPLDSVINIVHYMRTHPGMPPELNSLLLSADAELRRTAEISRNTLAFFRETGAPAPVDLRDAVQGSIELLANKARDRSVQLTTDYAGSTIIQGFGGGVRQIVINLVRNAIEASSPGSSVLISVHPAFDEALGQAGCDIVVSDSGPGIADSALRNLFRPQLSTKEDGNGIGLWIVKQIVEKHGGTISVESRTAAPTGTRFTVWLPTRFAAGMIPTNEAMGTAAVA